MGYWASNASVAGAEVGPGTCQCHEKALTGGGLENEVIIIQTHIAALYYEKSWSDAVALSGWLVAAR